MKRNVIIDPTILVGAAAMAARAGVQRGTIYRWEKQGLPLRRCPGGRIAIRAVDFDSWVLGDVIPPAIPASKTETGPSSEV
jgi:hypothetical protein